MSSPRASASSQSPAAPMSRMTLGDLLEKVATGQWGPVVRDHRHVVPGAVFVAICGRRVDARQLAPLAARQGAVAVVGKGPPVPHLYPGCVWVSVGDDRQALSQLAAAQHGWPSRYLGVTAVTGTNGKTTVTYLLEAIFGAAGRTVGRMGTVEVSYPGTRLPASMTTPDALDLHRLLAAMRRQGVQEVAMEASSHALAQRRLDDVEVDVAVLTNLRRDHLDYHRTLRAYRQAKGRLFTRLLGEGEGWGGYPRTAVLPWEDAAGEWLARRTRAQVVRYGVGDPPEPGPGLWVAARGVRLEGWLSSFTLWDGRSGRGREVRLPLPGIMNVRNALAAAAAAMSRGIGLEDIVAGLVNARGAPGRMECLYRGEFTVVLDFAHNPDGIQEMVRAARALVPPGGRLVVLMGAEGEKDPGKRRPMGRAAAQADELWITSDSPRGEDPQRICQQVAAGAREGKARLHVVVDRKEAIREAVAYLRPGDVLVVAGRGPETVQVVGEEHLPWSDAQVVEEALAARGLLANKDTRHPFPSAVP